MTEKKEISLNPGWKFLLDDEPKAAYKGFDDSAWKTVDLPHDWSVESPFDTANSSGTGYLPVGIGYYRKTFHLSADDFGKRVFINFDGIYNNSMVWCNSYYLGKRPSGYSPQIYEITDFVNFGENSNVLTVKADHRYAADSRWFTGSGIYRNVNLIIKEKISIDNYGIFVSTEHVDNEKAQLSVKISASNLLPQESAIKLRCTLYDANSAIVGVSEEDVLVHKNESIETIIKISVGNPTLWSPNNPYLYCMETEIIMDGKVWDKTETKIGIRTFRFDSEQGFFINNVNMKLKGVCVHHDAGCLGAAVRPEVWKRRLESLKKMGANAIRMSHNPHMSELYDLCNEMGFFVIDEAFDEWEGVKNKWAKGHNVYPPAHYGYYEDFPEWHERDLADMVKRDRNHPCVILWSIGNEIDYPNDPYCHPSFAEMAGNNDANKPKTELLYNPDKPNAERITVIAKELVSIVKAHDSTRPVTAAIACPELSNKIGYPDCLDVVGYNYMEHLYDRDHEAYPDRILLGSENRKDLAAWLSVVNNNFIAGQFLWTGIDFLGETVGWPSHGSSAGLLDLAGFEKPEYYFRQSLWSEKPMVKILTKASDGGADHSGLNSTWNYTDGEKLKVICYTNCVETELFVNEKSLGKMHRSENNYHFVWETEFTPGTLKAVSLDESGIYHDDILETVSEPKEIRLICDTANVKTDGSGMTHVTAEIVDSEGRLVNNADNMISISVEGGGYVLGIENGNLTDTMAYNKQKRKAHHGKLLIYVCKGSSTDKMILTAEAEGLIKGETVINWL